jgi:hypothetical protein
LWQLVVAIGVVIGILVGLGSFVDWGSRIRNRRANHRVLKLVRDQLTAEDIEGRLKRLVELDRSLREQIESLPAKADRLFLQNRMKALAESIAHDFEEYGKLEAALGTTEESPALNPIIRDVIERTMVSPQKRRDRRLVYVLVLLGLIVAIDFVPINISGLVYQYFGVLGDSPSAAGGDVVSAIIIGSMVIAVLLFLAELIPQLLPVLDRLRRPRWLVGLAVSIVLVAAVGYWFRYVVITQPCFQLVGCPPSPGTYGLIGVALNLLPLLAGLLFAILIRRAWLRRNGGGQSTGGRSVGETHQESTIVQPPTQPGGAPAS